MEKVRNLAEIAPSIGFTEFDFYDLYRSTFEKSELGRIKKLLPLREMVRIGQQKPEAETGMSFIFHAGRQGALDVPEDVHRTELPETGGTVEQQHSLPDILRRDNRFGEAVDELQVAG